ncbi:hypothetical protein J8273_5412 [Carpediemonas membranifera]|uniref:Uncharacterized protein n=1 Tax=Carpediemonas membranifera TaxID=201153 RepID=A0A8J6E2X2_9EUKA|nr:hypothetical protein J8273_5412 [Carpediemonas membranifera]|eukprot:KAG9392422.1 hypothetical protein J8273_5412 [Carpediemonas membranifera]
MAYNGFLIVGLNNGLLMHHSVYRPCFGLNEEQMSSMADLSRVASVLWAIFLNSKRMTPKENMVDATSHENPCYLSLSFHGHRIEFLVNEQHRILTVLATDTDTESSRFLLEKLTSSFCTAFGDHLVKQKALKRFAQWDEEPAILTHYANHLCRKLVKGFNTEWVVAALLPDSGLAYPVPDVKAALLESDGHAPVRLAPPDLPEEAEAPHPRPAPLTKRGMREGGLSLTVLTSLGYDRYTPAVLTAAVMKTAASLVGLSTGAITLELSFTTRRRPRPQIAHLGGTNRLYVDKAVVTVEGLFLLAVSAPSFRHDAATPPLHLLRERCAADVEALGRTLAQLHDLGLRGEVQAELGG